MNNHLNDFQNILQSNRKISHFYLNKDEQVVWKRDDYLLREDAINLLELFQMNTCKLEGNPFDVNEELASSQMRFLVIENIAYSLNTAIDRQTNLKTFYTFYFQTPYTPTTTFLQSKTKKTHKTRNGNLDLTFKWLVND